MKVTDLMLGDLILINNTPHRIEAIDGIDAEILADDNLYYVGEDRYRSEDKIEGIPITPEILEKNGWHFSVVTKVTTGEDGYWVYEEGGIELSLHFPIRPFAGLLRIFDKWLIRRMPDFMWKDTLYVHELQHALRLCRLDELADNFKV